MEWFSLVGSLFQMAATVVWRPKWFLRIEMTFQFQSFSFSRVSKRISSSLKSFTFSRVKKPFEFSRIGIYFGKKYVLIQIVSVFSDKNSFIPQIIE